MTGADPGRRPGLTIGDGWAVYEGGPLPDSDAHRHAAFQIAIALDGEIAMVEPSGRVHRGVALIVAPMVRHQQLAVARLRTFFIEPHSVFADRLRQRGDSGIAEAADLVALRIEDLRPDRSSSTLDARLVAAMRAATAQELSMAELAAAVGLSPQRLRTLARLELGMPLTRWRIWRRLARAATALRQGAGLAEAAVTGGFADQAHLTRQMREMMGLTPRVVLRALQPSDPAGHVDRD